MKKSQSKPKPLQITNIKSSIVREAEGYSDVELFCLEKSKNCYIYRDGETKKYKEDIALDNLSIYILDSYSTLKKVDFGRFKDRKVSIRFKLYHNGSSSHMIVKDPTGVYYLPTFFGKATKVKSLDEAKELWLADIDIVKDRGAYY